MQIRLFNTLTGKKEEFKSLEPGKVSMYACGPTVYHFAHIGNLRTYIFEDALARFLESQDLKVNHVMNITDVGHLQSDADDGADKMSVAAERERKTPKEIAEQYEKTFFEDCEQLHIKRPTVVCRATEHIDDMVSFIATLGKKGYTYQGENGNTYFNTNAFPTYQNFGKRNTKVSDAGARIEIDPNKKDPRDFVLWFKESKFTKQIMQWDTIFGKGFPGWHIECSAMAMKYCGQKADIHCGGQDHIGIHHKNEVAQSECYTGSKWVNYWLHAGFLVDKDGKMSKSKGSFTTLKTLTDMGFEPEHYRYFCLQGHYRKPLIYSVDLLIEARADYEKLKSSVITLKESKDGTTNPTLAAAFQEKFTAALCDDLDTPTALKLLWKVINEPKLSAKDKLELLYNFDNIFALGIKDFATPVLSAEQKAILLTRNFLRDGKDFAEADKLKKYLQAQDLFVEDQKDGSTTVTTFKRLLIQTTKEAEPKPEITMVKKIVGECKFSTSIDMPISESKPIGKSKETISSAPPRYKVALRTSSISSPPHEDKPPSYCAAIGIIEKDFNKKSDAPSLSKDRLELKGTTFKL